MLLTTVQRLGVDEFEDRVQCFGLEFFEAALQCLDTSAVVATDLIWGGVVVLGLDLAPEVVPLLDAAVFKFLEVVLGTVLRFLGAEEIRDRMVDHGFVHGLGNDIVGVGRVFYVPHRGDGAVDDGDHVPVLPDEVLTARTVVLGALAVEPVRAFGEGCEVGRP